MGNLRDIKDRIDSVSKTRKLTQAMKMVAAAKFKRASSNVAQSTPYKEQLQQIVQNISARVPSDELPAILRKNGSTKTAYILITGDRGLCGGFNSSIIKYAEQLLSEDTGDKSLYLFGNKGIQHFKKRRKDEIKETHSYFTKTLSTGTVNTAINDILKRFESGEYGRVYLVYNAFRSALSSTQVTHQLCPAVIESTSESGPESDYFYQGSPEQIVTDIIRDNITYTVYTAFLESTAAEEGARMAAMDSATDNAKELIGSLTLEFNRQRQAQITGEISEIVAGANAI